MSRRHVLEDSDSDDDGNPPASTDFFTPEEKEAIEKCDIQINNGGKYSEDLMSRAIARVGEPPLEAVKRGGGESSYERYCVKKDHEKEFFDRDIYKSRDSSPSEETILFDIEVIRRSEKATKNRMFKQKETGGMVVFGSWWNYAMQRLLELSSDKTLTAENFGQYTAVKIIRSLFSLMSKGLKDIVKPGNLQALSSKMGVDWKENTKLARKVINHCGGPNHFLDKELAVIEAHVESLDKKKTKAAPAAGAKPSAAASTGTGASSKAKSSADIDKKRSVAAKARLAAMRDKARQKPSYMADSGANGIASPKKSAASASVGGRESFAQGGDALRPGEPRSRNDAPRQNDGGYGRKHPPERAINNDGRNPSSQPSSRGGQSNASNPSGGASRQGNASNKTDDGWGRNRDGDSSPQPVKTKDSWKFARRTLGSNIPVHDAPPEAVRNDRNDRPAPQEVDSRGGAPERPPVAAARDNFSSRNDRDRDQRRGGESESRGSGGRSDSRSGSSPSRHSDSRPSGRYDDRPSDRRDEYSRSNSRGDYARGTSGGDDYRHSRSRDGNSRDYGGSSRHDEGSKRSRSQDRDRDNQPQKRFRPPNETRAPTASAPAPVRGAGRGRGAHVNKPAWLTQQEQGNGPTGMPRNDNGSATTGPAVAGMSSNYPTAASGAPPSTSVIAPSGAQSSAGRGRGAHKNLPAWMTKQGQGSTHNGPAGMPSNNNVGNNNVSTIPGAGVAGMNANHPTPSLNVTTAAPTGDGRGRGVNNVPARMPSSSVAGPPMGRGGGSRGRGTDNRPAWMTRQDSEPSSNVPAGMQQAAPSNVPAVMQQQALAPIVNLNAQALNPSHSVGGLTSNGGGRGRGRGRGKNLPAWMTNPPNP